MSASPTEARRDIARQRRLDRNRPQTLALLGVRFRAVAEAQRAVASREAGALPALRQSLIDLSAIAEALAEGSTP